MEAQQLKVLKANDADLLRSLENAIQFGQSILLESLGEELDPLLDSILLKVFSNSRCWLMMMTANVPKRRSRIYSLRGFGN